LFDVKRWELEISKTRKNYKTTIRAFADQTLMRGLIGLHKIEGYSADYHGLPWEEQLMHINSQQFKEEFSIDEFLSGKSLQEIRELAKPILEEVDRQKSSIIQDESLTHLISEDGTPETRRKICILEAFETINEYEKSISLVSNQILVLSATYFELILKDFFYLVFVFHPDRMYSFLGEGNKGNTGKVSLKQILEADSKQSLLLHLASQAALNANSGGYKAIFNNLKNITKNGSHSLYEGIEEDATKMLNIRNEIIHENTREKYLIPHTSQGDCVKEVNKSLDILEDFISELAHLAFYLYVPQNHFEPEDLWPDSVLAEAYREELFEKMNQIREL
jgi:hypothetical protein